jgi:hypothetical protein
MNWLREQPPKFKLRSPVSEMTLMRLFSAFFSKRLTLVLASMLLSTSGEAARNLYRDDKPVKSFRMSLLFPYTDYWSISNLTWGTANVRTWSLGLKMEWARVPADQMRRPTVETKLNYLRDLQIISSGTVGGTPVGHVRAGMYAAFWPIGGPPNLVDHYTSYRYIRKAELSVFAGPTLQGFTEIRTSVMNDVREIQHPVLLGLRFGARTCIPVGESACLELSGSTTVPIWLANPGGNVLNLERRSFDGSAILEFNTSGKSSMGCGVTRSVNQVEYQTGEERVQRVSFSEFAPVCTYQFRY